MDRPAGARVTVLITEDNAEARLLLAKLVQREGHTVVIAKDGSQALTMLERQPIDIVLLGLMSPEKDGYELLAEIKSDPRWHSLPVLLISAGGDEEEMRRGMELGAIGFLPKPFNQEVLRARLGLCLAERQKAGASQARPEGAPPSLYFGRIRVERLLGTGSMGNVFLGRHELLDLPVAVKLLRPEMLRSPEMRGRILREAQIAARVAHPNVVRLHEVGETAGGGFYLAYEYVDGGSLEDLLRRTPHHRLSVSEAVRITRCVAEGLGEVHRAGVTHRDVKPENVLLTLDGKVKIGDLGLAKQAGGAGVQGLTDEHVVVGTPAYMAPEQARGQKDLDIRCDLYALGAVLYEMLTGRPPFIEATAMATLMAHLNNPPRPPHELRRDLPTWLEAVCLKLLAKDREDRYPTPAALSAELEAHCPV
jgi:CheY-like chemotaxis protein/tRNA A-37 threonylcarbamoyl transferase component Bud32